MSTDFNGVGISLSHVNSFNCMCAVEMCVEMFTWNCGCPRLLWHHFFLNFYDEKNVKGVVSGIRRFRYKMGSKTHQCFTFLF